MHLQHEEIYAIMAFQISDIIDLFAGKKETIRNPDGLYFDRNKRLRFYARTWTKKDFIPAVDNYFGKAALVAQSIIQGERCFPGI